MLPSMPILFTRESQDGFFSKNEPSTSCFSQNSLPKTAGPPEFQQPQMSTQSFKATQKEAKDKNIKKKDQAKEDPSKISDNALDAALVRSYYTKVQSRFSSNQSVPTNKFVQFQTILKTFDPSKETAVDLYRKIEQLFGEEHKDIVEEFLLFLKPGQAANIGRFMDHLTLVQITDFIDLLQSTFSRKPTVLRKILRSITTGLKNGNSEMKSRVLPHLRSNPRLTQMFKSLFPDERPPDSLYETGTDIINESFLTCDKGYDLWELEEQSDSKNKVDFKERLDTTYVHGRVFLQHKRMLRAACVTYPYSKEPYRVHTRRLAPAHCHLSPPQSDDERSSPKRTSKNASKIPPKRTRKQPKSPTKNVKDVNDNTKKDFAANSPKTKGKQFNIKTKGVKEKKDEKTDMLKTKKEKHDSRNMDKKIEGSKAKQAKIDPLVGDSKKVDVMPVVNKAEVNLGDSKKFEIVPVKNRKVEVAPAEKKRVEVVTAERNRDEVAAEGKKVEVVPVEKKVEAKSNSWTREEDKTMLQILKGEAGSEQIFGRIRELLPHRSASEIKERFCHVMNLLQQMAVGEVT